MQSVFPLQALYRMGNVTRFQVMAMLQAARALALGLSLDEAKSWGLNRALFYAAAKHAWANAKAIGSKRPIIWEIEHARDEATSEYVLGGERAFISGGPGRGLRFKFGDLIQMPEDFDRQIKRRFQDWETAWHEANEIVAHADPRDLSSQHRFFDRVYKPRRDELAASWSELKKPRARRPSPKAA